MAKRTEYAIPPDFKGKLKLSFTRQQVSDIMVAVNAACGVYKAIQVHETRAKRLSKLYDQIGRMAVKAAKA